MSHKVFWTVEAEETLGNNILYLERAWNLQVINEFLDRVEDAIKRISIDPYIFPIHHHKKQIYKCVLTSQIVIYFAVGSKEIYILTFWNTSQRPSRLKL
jgi:plasmid stabilization system protein ParE